MYFSLEKLKLRKTYCKLKFYKLIASAFGVSVCLRKPLILVLSCFSLCFLRHEVININLRNKPEWYYTKHPFGQIPVLENSKCQLIYESVIACEYLDDAYPGRKLYPYDPYERARQKMLLELFYKILGYQNTIFFGGDCISMIDYLFWPWFERLDVYGIADCLNHTPALRLWTAAMKQDPTVCALLIDKNIFLGFLNLYFQNNPDAFDYGLTC
uniref:glutathione S-transferase omega-2 isoform X2 n=1 Tax=Halichoerus grypus TaxID=9711 RepID=UPI001659189D|nr:glutathione S-transferase omega-2 isoform X2 [Halichoerus grypus]